MRTRVWRRAHHHAWLIGALSLHALGCEQAAKEVVRAVAVEPVVTPEVKAVSAEQEKRFIERAMDAAKTGDAASINDLIDWTLLSRRAARGLHAPQAVLDGVVKGARDGCAASGVCASLAQVGQGKAKLRHLGPHMIGSERWLSFRRMPGEGGFDHISFLLSTDAQGVARAIDVLVLSLGETSSSTLRRALLPMLALDEEHVVRRMQGTESAFARHGAEISKAQALASQGKPTEALALLSALPTTLRNDPFVMAQRVTITRMAGDEQAYLTAIDDLAKRHPNDPVTVLNQLDAHTLRQRYTDALNVVQHIETLVAPDPYLNVLRANLLTAANLPLDAAIAATAAITREPDLIEAHWALVAATLKQPDYAATTRALLSIHKQFGLTLQLEGVPDYAAYVASPAYAELKAQLSP